MLKSLSTRVTLIAVSFSLLLAGFMCDSLSFAQPVAHWTFDDSGDRYADSSGNGNTLGPVGTVGFVAGVSGDAMSVNGGGKANVQFGSLSTSELTISIWGDMADGVATFDDYWTYSTGVTTPRVGILENQGGSQAAAWFGPNGVSPGVPNIATGGFHHMVLSASAATNTVTLYVDGSSVGSNIWSETDVLNWFTLGGEFDTGIRNLDVDLDEVQIYDFAITANEVAFLFDNPGEIVVRTPEPSALMMAAVGFVCLGVCGRRRRRQ